MLLHFFSIRQCNHIVKNNPGEMYEAIRYRMLATVGTGQGRRIDRSNYNMGVLGPFAGTARMPGVRHLVFDAIWTVFANSQMERGL